MKLVATIDYGIESYRACEAGSPGSESASSRPQAHPNPNPSPNPTPSKALLGIKRAFLGGGRV